MKFICGISQGNTGQVGICRPLCTL